jgi:hypothetical protein
MDQNTNFFDWDGIPDDNVLFGGNYRMRVQEVDDVVTSTGKRMLKVRFVVEEPDMFANMSHFENYVVGTEENPMGLANGSMGTQQLKKLFKASQVPRSNNIEELLGQLTGAICIIAISRYAETKKEYAGQLRNKITGYYKVGERETGITEAMEGAARPVQHTMPAPPAMPQAARPAPQPAPAYAPPPPSYAPAPPAPPAAPSAPETPGVMNQCPICKAQVPAVNFQAHLMDCIARR